MAKRVIIKNYNGINAKYNGQIGTVIKQDTDDIWTVKMADGKDILPYAPGYSKPQCELLEEIVTTYQIY